MRLAKPHVIRSRARKFAEQQGYRWIPNPDPDMPFDALAYHAGEVIIVRIRTSRNAPGEFELPESDLEEDFRILSALPLPASLQREVWARYSWSRTFHRFRMIKETFVETTALEQERPAFSREAEKAGALWGRFPDGL